MGQKIGIFRLNRNEWQVCVFRHHFLPRFLCPGKMLRIRLSPPFQVYHKVEGNYSKSNPATRSARNPATRAVRPYQRLTLLHAQKPPQHYTGCPLRIGSGWVDRPTRRLKTNAFVLGATSRAIGLCHDSRFVPSIWLANRPDPTRSYQWVPGIR